MHARADADRLAGTLADVISQPFELEGGSVQVGASVGAALYPDDGADFAALLHAADMRMYQVKRPTG